MSGAVFRSRRYRVARGVSVRFEMRLEPPGFDAQWHGALRRDLPSRVRNKTLDAYRRGRAQFLAGVATEVGGDIMVLCGMSLSELDLVLAKAGGSA
jgi:hypothetical protein